MFILYLIKSQISSHNYHNKISPIFEHSIRLKFENKVLVTESMISFDELNLLVDVGSSLGLWMGLSVFGILDKVVQFGNDAAHKFLSFIN